MLKVFQAHVDRQVTLAVSHMATSNRENEVSLDRTKHHGVSFYNEAFVCKQNLYEVRSCGTTIFIPKSSNHVKEHL